MRCCSMAAGGRAPHEPSRAGLAGRCGGDVRAWLGSGALSQKLLVTLLNSVYHRGLFLLYTGAALMQPFYIQKYGSDPVLVSHRYSFVRPWQKASKKKCCPCYVSVVWFPPCPSSGSS